MKFIFFLGGFTGFALTAAAGYFAGHPAERLFFDAAVGCLAGAMLFRWFWAVVLRGFREVARERHAAAMAAAAANRQSKLSH